MTSAFRLLAKLFTEFLAHTTFSVGLLVLLGSAYTQVMIGLTLGVVLIAMAAIMSRIL